MNFMERFQASWRKFRRPGYYKEFDYAWTMTIDLDRCTGCGACVTACQAENNIPDRWRKRAWDWPGNAVDTDRALLGRRVSECETQVYSHAVPTL